jgi:hypothetical protein
MGSIHPHPYPRIPVGYMILSNNVPMGRTFILYPPLYRVIPVGYLGFGYPLPCVVVTKLRSQTRPRAGFSPQLASPGRAKFAEFITPPRYSCFQEFSLLARASQFSSPLLALPSKATWWEKNSMSSLVASLDTILLNWVRLLNWAGRIQSIYVCV